MPRPKKSDLPDLSDRVNLTVGAIERLTCPPDRQQVFMRDAEVPGLRVRCTAAGAKSYVFEQKLNRQTIRRTIGDVRAWTIPQARAEARRLAVLLDNGQDPRELERKEQAEREAQRQQEQSQAEAQTRAALPASEAWAAYLKDRQRHWGERHCLDHLQLSKAGGEPSKRAPGGKTQPGPLHSLLALPLKSLDSRTVEQWADREGQERPTVARLAFRLLKAFLTWCSEQPEYADLCQPSNPTKTRRTREALGKAGVKNDALLKEQLPAWFAAVRQIHNPTVAAYLQTILLTGARPGEVLTMRWEDVGTQWRSLTIRDKVEGERMIPLTPYVHSLIAALPRRNEWVFSSPRSDRQGEHMTRLDPVHASACRVAGIEGLTLHGLRRSFKSLTEWLEIPAGVVAQIMGHKPSATAEKHYTVRPLDLLRVHHERIEAWMLEQAGVQFDAQAEPGRLRVVAG